MTGKGFDIKVDVVSFAASRLQDEATEIGCALDGMNTKLDGLIGADPPWGHDAIGRAFGEFYPKSKETLFSTGRSASEKVADAGGDLTRGGKRYVALEAGNTAGLDRVNRSLGTG
jgi:hypothetical protein